MGIKFEDEQTQAPQPVRAAEPERRGRIKFEDAAPAPAPKPSATSAATDIFGRGLVAGTLGAPVDLATLLSNLGLAGLGYAGYETGLLKQPLPLISPESAVGSSEYIGKLMERAGMVTPTRRPVAEQFAAISPLIAAGGAQAAKGIGSLAKRGIDYYRTSRGTEAEELSKALRTRMTGTIEDVIQAQEARMPPAEKRLAEIGRAEQQVAGREPIATARQAARERQVEQSLNAVSPQRGVLDEDVGGVIQSAGKKNVEALKGVRETEAIQKVKDPAFDAARAREAKGDFISTNPNSSTAFQSVIGEIEQQIARTPEPYASELKKRLTSLRGKEVPLNEGEIRAAQLRATIEGKDPSTVPTTRTEPMTMDQAEFLRRMLNDKEAFKVEGFEALTAVRQNQLADLIASAMNAYEPRMGEFLAKYKSASEPISRAVAGRARKLTEVEVAKAEQDVLYSSDGAAATRYFLDGSEERAKRLLELVGGKTKPVEDNIKGYLRYQLEGMDAKQAAKFLRNNEGLLRAFPEYRAPIEAVVSSKRAAETMGPKAAKEAQAAVTRLGGEAKVVGQELSEATKIADKYRVFENKLVTSNPKDAVSESKTIADNLRKDRLINDDVHRQILTQIEGINSQYGETAQAKQQIQLLMRKVLIYSGLGATGYAGYGALKALGQ